MDYNEKTTIECAGCKRSQTLRKRKIIVCDYYVCSFGDCKINPDFNPPLKEGFVRVIEYNAAGGFCGIIDRLPNEEEQEAVNRAKGLKDLGLLSMETKGQSFKHN